MKWQSMGAALALLVLGVTADAGAAPAVNVQLEVNFLLGYIEGSGCEFRRNGAWHDGAAAQVHIRDKFNALVMKDRIQTTEEFIERAACAEQPQRAGLPDPLPRRSGDDQQQVAAR